MRVKLASRGVGPLAGSAGYRSKFGLTLTEVLEAFEYLKARGMDDCLQLTHFHLGSQITNIRKVKDALTEAARVYVELHRLGAGLKYIDVGGGLGIDYDGSQTDFESSINYTLQEYANDVVFRIKRSATRPACRTRRSSPRPAGRWSPTTACWSSTCSARPNFDRLHRRRRSLPDDAPQPIRDLFGIYRDLNKKNFLESYHDAVQADGRGAQPVQPRLPVDRAAGPGRAAVLGVLPQAPADRPRAGLRAGGAARPGGHALGHLLLQLLDLPVDARLVGDQAALPDHADPPAQRSRRRGGRSSATSPATRTARSTSSSTCATCAARWSCTRYDGASRTTSAAFLLGAYQEILGDLHNLFGDTNAVHVIARRGRHAEHRHGHQGRHGARGAALRAVLAPRS